MPNLTNLLGTAAVVVAIATGAHAQDDAKTQAPTADTVVATVNGTDITLGQMQVALSGLPPQYAQLDDETLFKGVLDQMIQQTALSEIGEGRKTKRDDIALEVQRRAYLAGSYLEYAAKEAVTDEAVQKAYDETYASADPVKEYHAAHIIVPTEERAEILKTELDDGADFAKLAKDNSQDGAAENGGDLGWFALDAMVEPFGEAVAKMEDGDISDPVQTNYGWHLIKLEGTRMSEAPALDDVRAELENKLQTQAMQDRVTSTVDEADVERMDDGIDPAVLKDESLLDQ